MFLKFLLICISAVFTYWLHHIHSHFPSGGDPNALGHAVTFHRAKLPGPAIIRLHAGLGEHRVGTRLNTIVDLISESVGDRQRAKQLPVRDKTVNITQREKT